MVHAIKFSFIARHLYKLGSDEILHPYVLEFERRSILVDAHGSVVGGYYAGRETA